MSHENTHATTAQTQFSPAAYSHNSLGVSQPAVPPFQKKAVGQQDGNSLPDTNALVKIAVQASQAPPTGSVAQLARADVRYKIGNRDERVVNGNAVGLGGQGGVSHSEQGVWNRVRVAVLAGLGTADTHVRVNFIVDTTICHGCSPWFEDTVWTALNDAAEAHDSTFELIVTVDGNDVTVDGNNTIWPPEIADAPTFDRMGDMDRSMRFLDENRDEDGHIRDEPHNDYIAGQIDTLNTVIDENQYNGITRATVGDAFNTGRDNCVTVNEGRFDETEEEIGPYLANFTFSAAITSGMVAIPPFVQGNRTLAVAVQRYLRELELVFQGWFTYQLEEHFGPNTEEADD